MKHRAATQGCCMGPGRHRRRSSRGPAECAPHPGVPLIRGSVGQPHRGAHKRQRVARQHGAAGGMHYADVARGVAQGDHIVQVGQTVRRQAVQSLGQQPGALGRHLQEQGSNTGWAGWPRLQQGVGPAHCSQAGMLSSACAGGSHPGHCPGSRKTGADCQREQALTVTGCCASMPAQRSARSSRVPGATSRCALPSSPGTRYGASSS